MHRSESAFQTQANRICTRINTSPYLDTKARYAQDLRKTRTGLAELGHLHPPKKERSTYRALLTHMKRIYMFTKAHVPAEIALARQGQKQLRRLARGQKTRPFGTRFVALTSRQVGHDYNDRVLDSRTLGFPACDMVGTTGKLRAVGSG
jgi:hypothetical protein